MLVERRFVLTLLLSTSFLVTNELEQWIPLSSYKVQKDPNHVKPDRITMGNLFGWLNLKNSIKFRLWTRSNPNLAQEIKYQNIETLKTSNFDPRKLTKFIIHGFADSATEVAVTPYLFHLRDAYLHLADVNIFIMDYSLFALPIFYYAAVPDLPGLRLAEFLEFLLTNSYLNPASIHLIGFSLGAQVAGLAGHRLKGQLGRITGLDPAGPTFHYLSNDPRLDRSDAQFVDIIHTSSGKNFWSEVHLGIDDALGHADFYPNNGTHQIGCVKPKIFNFSYKNLECSHGRSARYFIESITSPLAFPAVKCESFKKFVVGDCNCGKIRAEEISYMGEHLSHTTRGVFQLVTKTQKPFGLGPQMDLMLPDVAPELTSRVANLIDPRRAIAFKNKVPHPPETPPTEAIVIFNKSKLKLRYKHTYNAIDFPNNDVYILCQNLLTANNATFTGEYLRLKYLC